MTFIYTRNSLSSLTWPSFVNLNTALHFRIRTWPLALCLSSFFVIQVCESHAHTNKETNTQELYRIKTSFLLFSDLEVSPSKMSSSYLKWYFFPICRGIKPTSILVPNYSILQELSSRCLASHLILPPVIYLIMAITFWLTLLFEAVHFTPNVNQSRDRSCPVWHFGLLCFVISFRLGLNT